MINFNLGIVVSIVRRFSLAIAFFVLVAPIAAAIDLVDNKNGTVTDKTTGLHWQKLEGGKHTWEEALLYCEKLVLGGFKDWRLPSIYELKSIVDNSRYNPAIDSTFFPGASPSVYWSSSTPTGHEDYAWFVSFNHGHINVYNKTYSYYVRCVQGKL